MFGLMRGGLIAMCLFLVASCAASPANGPVVFYDLTPLLKLDLKQTEQRKRFWDECHLVFALQGIVNRHEPRLFVRWVRAADDFWWQEMTRPGGWLAKREVIRLGSLNQLLERFAKDFRGTIVWDDRVPSTSNLASTIAGCDDLLPVRFDEAEGSLYRKLSARNMSVAVRLLREDGQPMFAGRGTIEGTSLQSSGSAKCDAYLWLIERYLKTGKANPQCMGYYLDAFWQRCWNAGAPQNHTLSNHDFVIARRGVLFDLGVWDDEASVDDSAQKPGADVATLKQLLRAAYDRFGGNGMIHVAGFVPWAYKYTDFKNAVWSAGGKHGGVPTEWRYAEILSCFNAYMDADALGLSAMANASFFQHFPLAPRYPQKPAPTRESVQAAGLLDAQGRIMPRGYVSFYVGDYDAAAWLYRELPRMWADTARGSTPLSWAFNPNLCARFPLGMAWAREHQSTNDFFITGDSGAGYLNPGYLVPPRKHSELPSGLAAWEQHCERLYRQWDLSVTGFVIDGYAPPMSSEVLDAYARFSPGGIVGQKVPPRSVHRGMPILRMRGDMDGAAPEAARSIQSLASGTAPKFVAVRSILKTPAWHAEIARNLQTLAGDSIRVVDMATLLWLAGEFETNPASRASSPFTSVPEVNASPEKTNGLVPIRAGDGPFDVQDRNGAKCWRVQRRFFYCDVDDAFASASAPKVEIGVEFLDEGKGRISLQYDSRDPRAAVEGAYKQHSKTIERRGGGQWRTESFVIDDAKFEGRENGETDFRIVNNGDELFIRSVRVKKIQQ